MRASAFRTAEQQRVFEKFYRLAGTTRAVSGTGLGLYICRELVRRMDGRNLDRVERRNWFDLLR